MRVPVPDELLPAERLGHVHFVGIGGAGLSGIARIMLARGMTVSGSDAKESRAIEALRVLGATCYVGHAADQVRDADTLVVSTAVREDNPEVVEARRLGLRLLPRSAALESVMQGRKVVERMMGLHQRTHRHLDYDKAASAIFTEPEIADVGLAEAEAFALAGETQVRDPLTEHNPARELGQRQADGLGYERHGARRARVGLDHVQLAAVHRVLDVEQPDDPDLERQAAGRVADLLEHLLAE